MIDQEDQEDPVSPADDQADQQVPAGDQQVPAVRETVTDQRVRLRKARFLVELEKSANVTWAAKIAGWASEDTAYHWRNKDKDFEAAWEIALKRGIALLEVVSRERAIEYEEVVMYQGLPVPRRDPNTGEALRDQFGDVLYVTVKKYDSRQLELQLKRHHPAYRDKVTVDQNVNGEVRLRKELDMTKLTKEERVALRPLLEGMAARAALEVNPRGDEDQ